MPDPGVSLFLSKDAGTTALNRISVTSRRLISRAIFWAAVGDLSFIVFSVRSGNTQGVVLNSLLIFLILVISGWLLREGKVASAFDMFVCERPVIPY